MGKVSRLYKSLSDNQRYNFWSAATNLFLCMFTFWLGITIQFIVVDKTVDYQKANAYLQYWEYIEPDYKKMLLTVNTIGESVLNQELYDMLRKKENVEMSKEQLKIINKFDSDYKEIMSNVDQFTESAVSLAYALSPNNEKRKQILKHVNRIEIGKIIISAIRNDVHTDSLKSVIYQYYKSDEFIIAHKTFTSFIREDNELIEDMIGLVKETLHLIGDNIYAEKFSSYYLFASLVGEEIFEICKICENELMGLTENKCWNELPLFYKSVLVLICMIVIGYFISRWFLRKLVLPSDPRRDYTAEEYKKVKNERESLHNLVIVNADTMERQTKEIKNLQNKVRDLEELNWEYYSEIKRLKGN